MLRGVLQNTFALDVGYDVVRSMYYALAEDCQANGNMQGQVFSELKFNVLSKWLPTIRYMPLPKAP